MKIHLKSLACSAVIAAGWLAAPILSAQTAYNLTVKSGPLRQSFAGFGASQLANDWGNLTPTPRSTMSNLVYHDLKANVLRLWVTTSDSITVSQMLSEFNTSYVASGAITDIKGRGVTTLLLAPGAGPSGTLPASISTYATNLAELILQIKNTYGVTIDVTGLSNEPEPVWSPANIVDGIKYLRAALDSRGLTGVQIIAPESPGTGTAADTVPVIYADGTAWNGIMGIASHSYGAVLEDDKLENLKRGKKWWTTEASEGGAGEVAEDENRASTILARFLTELNHGSDQWVFFLGLGELGNLSTSPFGTAFLTVYDQNTSSVVTLLKYFYFKQALSTIDRGAIFRKCVSGSEGEMFLTRTLSNNINPAISAAAAYNPDGSWGINVVNETGITGSPADSGNTFPASASYNVTVTVEELAGSGTKSFNLYRSKAGTHFVSSGTVTFTNGVSTAITVGSKELISLRSAATAAAIPPVPTGVSVSTYNAPVMLTWNNTVKATSWNVKKSTTPGGPYTTLVNTTTTSCGDWFAVQGTVYYYVITAVNASGESANSAQVVASPSPNPWTNYDIPTVSKAGGVSYSDAGGIFTTDGYGSSLGGTNDSYNFTYQPMTGDGTIIARLVKGTEFTNAKFGVVMSEYVTTSPKAVGLLYDFNGAMLKTFMWARSTAGSWGVYNDIGTNAVPAWFKLVRAGNIFTGYKSSNGTSWSMISSTSIPMNSTIYVGLSNCYGHAVYDNVSTPAQAPTGLKETASPGQIKLNWNASAGTVTYKLKRATSPGGTYTTLSSTIPATTLSYTDSTIASGTNYYYVVSAVNANGESPNSTELKAWQNANIGTLTAPESCVTDGSTYNVSTAGVNIGTTSDSFNVTYRMMTGDGTVIARLASGTSGSNGRWGIMMSENLGVSPKAVGVLYDFNGFWLRDFMWIRSTAGSSASFLDSAATPPTWFKLTRVGNTFTGYASANGTSWTTISSATISMASTIYVGLTGCSSSSSVASPASFDNVTAP